MFFDEETVHHTRSIYTGLDMLGDVGGLVDGLRFIGTILIYFFNFLRGDPLQSYLVGAVL